jgi:hypothetical protein
VFDWRVATQFQIPYFFDFVEHPGRNVLFNSGWHGGAAFDSWARLGSAGNAEDIWATEVMMSRAGFVPSGRRTATSVTFYVQRDRARVPLLGSGIEAKPVRAFGLGPRGALAGAGRSARRLR